MRSFRKIGTVLAVTVMVSSNVFADTSSLEQRLNDLEQQVAVLKRQLENEKETSTTKAKDTPIITANAKDGFSIKSADEGFKLKVRGLLQADSRTFTNNKKDLSGTTDTFLVRRARPIFEGTVNKNFDFYLIPDFANTPNGSNQAILVDAYADIKLTPSLKIRGGKFKAPLGLERLQSDAVANFIETGLPSNLVPNRDYGFQVFGDLFGDSVNYAVGIFNGGADLASVDTADTNNDKDVIGRVFVQPFKATDYKLANGLGLGLGVSYGHTEGSTLPTYRSPGQASVYSYLSNVSADGAHTRYSPQLSYYNGSFGLLGEYVVSDQEATRRLAGQKVSNSFENRAWQVSTNYVLTGELASYKGITPRNNFDLEKGTWGAFEVVTRYGELKLDDALFQESFADPNASISEERAWAAGLNCYLNKNIRLSLDFEHTEFKGGAKGSEDRIPESVVSSRIQLAY